MFADLSILGHLGDAPVLLAAQSQIRNGFREKAALDPTDSETTQAVQHAQEVAKFLRENLVQGRRAEGDEHNYSTIPLARRNVLKMKHMSPRSPLY